MAHLADVKSVGVTTVEVMRDYGNEWGDALNFDGADAGPVREYSVANAGYWIDEFHVDGLRLDAVQSIHDRSAEHVVAAITMRARGCRWPVRHHR